MNWYKNIKFAQVYYTSIGHNQFFNSKRPCKDYIWIFDGSKLNFREAKKMQAHADFYNDRQLDTMYKGRVEICEDGKNRASISVPDNRSFYEVPNRLILALKKQFGDNLEIHNFY